MRADVYLFEHGLARSRSHAARLIAEGKLTVDGAIVRKAGTEISDEGHRVEVSDDVLFVGRGGVKLAAALDAFGIDPTGLTAIDVGASTGGFTDCLLRRGAREVFAVDVGVGQLADTLRADARVHSIEKCNARTLTAERLGDAFPTSGADLVVMDVSFISQTLILPVLPALMNENAAAVTLIKPQFEVGRAHIGKGGIVKEPIWRRKAVERVFCAARTCGMYPIGLIRSPIEGGDGNVEYLAGFSRREAENRDTWLMTPEVFR